MTLSTDSSCPPSGRLSYDGIWHCDTGQGRIGVETDEIETLVWLGTPLEREGISLNATQARELGEVLIDAAERASVKRCEDCGCRIPIDGHSHSAGCAGLEQGPYLTEVASDG